MVLAWGALCPFSRVSGDGFATVAEGMAQVRRWVALASGATVAASLVLPGTADMLCETDC